MRIRLAVGGGAVEIVKLERHGEEGGGFGPADRGGEAAPAGTLRARTERSSRRYAECSAGIKAEEGCAAACPRVGQSVHRYNTAHTY